MIGTGIPPRPRRETISGTAAAAASLFTVTRTSSLPASASARTCSSVAATSAVSVLVMDCTAMGCRAPIGMRPIITVGVGRRVAGDMAAIYVGRTVRRDDGRLPTSIELGPRDQLQVLGRQHQVRRVGRITRVLHGASSGNGEYGRTLRQDPGGDNGVGRFTKPGREAAEHRVIGQLP